MRVLERPPACPREGQIEPFDAGWHAHEVGLSRETVRVLAADPAWALLGWDSRALVASRADSQSQDPPCIESEDCEAQEWHYWRCPKHADSHYRERPIEEDFYLDPRGEWVYRWSDERRVLKPADSQEDKT